MMPKTWAPALNHVALTLPSDALDESGRKEIVGFYGDVFGWREYDMLTADRKLLVLGLPRYDQFVYLIGADVAMSAPHTDHFGLAVSTLEEFDELLARIKTKMATDDRIHLEDHSVDDREVVKIHSLYVRHLLPLTVEVQWWEWPPTAASSN
jgi:hypothetical protein